MPDIGVFHPQIVHFVVALLIVGVGLRLVSLTGKLKWTSPAATTLLLLGTVAAVLAVQSGDDAHGPVERVPGARDAVVEHEEWGERARNIFLGVAALELIALAGAGRKWQRGILAASAVVGLAGGFAVFEAAEHGGELVYSYAGGVGVRSGEAADLNRLMTAALYHNLVQDRTEGRHVDAARLIDELASRNGGDPTVEYLVVESMMIDRRDPARARGLLADISPPADQPRLVSRHALLLADAFEGLGFADSARAALEAVKGQLPETSHPAIDRRIARIGQAPPQ
ncbi:MAG: DUF2231 domain-containing protein [Gemmatimonadota bacterium]|nr:DUF2231 domain-containing protein [Gemmatimonadota bacterium]